jgi:hypothetical protein
VRGTKAKAIRKAVYGDNSIRTREYLKGHEPQMGTVIPMAGGLFHYRPNPTCICKGLRRRYQDAKREVKK